MNPFVPCLLWGGPFDGYIVEISEDGSMGTAFTYWSDNGERHQNVLEIPSPLDPQEVTWTTSHMVVTGRNGTTADYHYDGNAGMQWFFSGFVEAS